jgi:hypothetical protein
MERDQDSPEHGKWTGRRFAFAVALVVALGIGAVALIRSGGSPPGSAAPAQHGTPTGTERPTGGITQEEAIVIASGIDSDQRPPDFRATAEAQYDDGYGRWTWHVSWGDYASPTGSSGCDMILDLMTGEILHRQCWVS